MEIGRLEIGPVKYDETETEVVVKSLLLSYLVGFPSGILPNLVLGFPAVPKPDQIPTDFIGWATTIFLILLSLESLCIPISLGFCLSLLKASRIEYSLKSIGECLLAMFVFFPVLFLYAAIVFSAVVVPFNRAFSWLGPVKLYWIGALLFLPFVILFGISIMLDSPARKFLRRYIRKSRRRHLEN